MNNQEKIKMLSTMVDEHNTDILQTYLRLAESKILQRAYPFGGQPGSFPEEYDMTSVEVAAYMVNKRGAEGETAHSEGGVSRSYEDADIPSSMLRNVMCHAAAVNKEP